MNPYFDLQRISIDEVIAEFTQLYKEKKDLVNQTLVFSLKFDVFCYKKKHEFEIYKPLSIFLHSPSNHTKVCFLETDDVFFDKSKEFIELNFEADHDSCWRDGVTRIIKNHASKIEKEIERKHPKIKNRDLHVHVSFDLFGLKLIDATIDGRNGYESGKAKLIFNK